MIEPTKLLEVRHLTKRFAAGGWFRRHRLHALEDVSFTIERGQVVALVGESGSGWKRQPDGGQAKFGGAPEMPDSRSLGPVSGGKERTTPLLMSLITCA